MEIKEVRFNNMDWFLENFNELEQKYTNEWIAIFNNEIIANAKTSKELRQKIKDSGIVGAFVTRVSKDGWKF